MHGAVPPAVQFTPLLGFVRCCSPLLYDVQSSRTQLCASPLDESATAGLDADADSTMGSNRSDEEGRSTTEKQRGHAQ